MPIKKSYESKTLYHRAKGGELRVWRCWAEGVAVCTEYGQQGGAMQTSRKECRAMNKGQANATTEEQQAILEAKALYKHKLDRKYSETPEEAQEQLDLPMLANKFDDKAQKKIKFPVFVQPKLDGMRLGTSREGGELVFTTRGGKTVDLPHITNALGWLPAESKLDGELYIHGMSCQAIMSLVKNGAKADRVKIEYHIYDVPEWEGETGDFSTRSYMLQDSVGVHCHDDSPIKVVRTQLARNAEDVWKFHGECVAEGYEGCMVRTLTGLYEWGARSNDLLKVKKFDDGEFKVVGFTEGRGKMAGCVIWNCQNEEGSTFEATHKCTMAQRAKYFKEGNAYIGQMVTVRHFGFCDPKPGMKTGVPRFPIATHFRIAEDLPKKKG